jgi:acyl-CoA synthetase (AMP-forming)/AMP-acid ligase II
MTSASLAENLIHRVNVGDSLTRSAARHPERIAILDGGRELSYAELNSWVNRLARGLSARGYSRGNVLALASGNSAEFLLVYYACAKLGVVCVPINLAWRGEEARYVLEHSEASGIVIEAQLLPAYGAALGSVPAPAEVIVAPGTGGDDHGYTTLGEVTDGASEAEPECLVGDRDPLTYLYTSGTTSAAKGVVASHTAIYLESMSVALEAKFDAGDRFVAMMPMFHTAQLNCFCTAAVMVGATIHVLRAFEAGELLALIETEGITQIFGLPAMYRAMLDHPDLARRDLSSLRRACYAMAPMPDEQLREAIERFGCGFFLLFGQTEMSPTTTFFRPEHQLSHPGSVGTPVANIQRAIMSEDGELLAPGQVGEIVYRGPHTMTGYLKEPAATDAVFAGGWFHSGDAGYVDSDGMLWFSDRFKDVIKTGGENVASIEVEKALYGADPRVGEAVVIGLPHERWHEAITAVVVPKPGESLAEDELLAAVRTRLAPYKVPKAVIITDGVPKTSTGKIQKNKLRSNHAEYYTGVVR